MLPTACFATGARQLHSPFHTELLLPLSLGPGALQEEAVAVAAGHFYLAFASLAFGLPPALRSLLLAPFLLLLLYPTPAQPPTFRPPTHFTSSSSQKKKTRCHFFFCLSVICLSSVLQFVGGNPPTDRLALVILLLNFSSSSFGDPSCLASVALFRESFSSENAYWFLLGRRLPPSH